MAQTRRKWSEEDVEYLKENINRYTYRELAQILGRSLETLKTKVRALGLKKDNASKKWSEEDVEYLKENINRYSYQELAQILGRSTNACAYKAMMLGLKKDQKISHKPKRTNIDWDEEKLYLLVSLRLSFEYKIISQFIGCTQVECKRKYESLTEEEKERILKTQKSLYK